MENRLTVITAVSEEAARDDEAFVVDSEILFNGVDVEFYRGTEPQPSDRPAIFFVGRHEPRKGLAVLLDAFAGLDRDAVLWVASSGHQTASLRALGVPNVEWLGRISEAEKAARLRGATIACAPSIEGESFGVVLLEAMAAGTAVIASDLTGYRAVARGDNEARLVPPGDVAELRLALRDLLDDPGERDRFAKAGTERAEEFSIDHLAERFLAIYEQAIRTARSGTGVARPVRLSR
jgi:phosphatidylinositol alpha-mannosyltransferase